MKHEIWVKLNNCPKFSIIPSTFMMDPFILFIETLKISPTPETNFSPKSQIYFMKAKSFFNVTEFHYFTFLENRHSLKNVY